MSNAEFGRLLRLINQKNMNVVTMEDAFDELYPAPFSRKIHVIVFAVMLWCFLVMMALIFTL